jgi:hypothetical protein
MRTNLRVWLQQMGLQETAQGAWAADALKAATKRMSAADMRDAIARFSQPADAASKFTMDALRLKARCLTVLKRHDEARADLSMNLGSKDPRQGGICRNCGKAGVGHTCLPRNWTKQS